MDAKKEIEEIEALLEHVETEKKRSALVSRFKKVWEYQKANDPKNKTMNEKLKNLMDRFKSKQEELKTGKKEAEAESAEKETYIPKEKKKAEKEKEEEKREDREERKERKHVDKEEILEIEEGLEDKKSDIFSKLSWKVLDTYFKANPNYLVNHQLDSYNQFMQTGIRKIFYENNPLKYIENRSDALEHPNIILLYIGGKNADKIYYGKPIIYDEHNVHFMYPNEARLRNMTYGLTIHYDVDIEMLVYDPEKNERVPVNKTIEKVYLGRFPIMLNSELCILSGLSRELKYNLGECRQDYGGYFIIDGKEKLIIPEEKFADNMIYVKEIKDDINSHSVEVRSVSEDSSKPMRTTSVQLVAPSTTYTNGQLVVTIPNVRKPIPLFIVMRALGVISDRDIIKTCLLDMDKYSHFVDLFIPSVHDANQVFDQVSAIKFIATFVKNKSVPLVLNILINMFIPHVGEMNFVDKAYYIGYMVKKMLTVYLKEEPPTDRDSFLYKRIDLSGILLYDLFKEFYNIQKNTVLMNIDKAYNMERDSGVYTTNFASIMDAGDQYFKERVVEMGFKKAFKGNWGSQAYTKKVGVVQDLNRLSWFTAQSHLRKSNLPMPEGAKVMGPRKLNGSQWGYVDILDVPEGSHIGFQKHLSITSTITSGTSAFPIIAWIKKHIGLTTLTECSTEYLSDTTKIFVNGNWVGNVDDPIAAVSILRLNRRNGIIPSYTSISFRIQNKEIVIYTDSGRLIRPVYYTSEGKPSFQRPSIGKHLNNWDELVAGFGEKNVRGFDYRQNLVFDPATLYANPTPEFLKANQCLLDYIDVSEEETSLIAMSIDKLTLNKHNKYTHIEIDPSTILGLMGNCIIFPENNPLPRNNFSGSQSRQAVSIYHTNFQNRIDKMGVILNYGNIPLVKSRYLKYINDEQIPYGVNCVVAIMSYTGYNVEDAILFNEASIKRGLFRTSYYSMYEEREDSSKISGGDSDSIFANIQAREVVGTKMGYDYSKLDEYGLIREGEQIDDKTIVIGKVKIGPSGIALDDSKKPKKGQLGYVDKSFITEGEEGFRLAKIRVREDRSPAVGDKFASRSGQKGTVGYVIPEANMPFTSQGIRPDLIINPHALPSRMTIGQLVESLLGKACSIYGTFGDCTAFVSKGPNTTTYGSLLQNIKHKEQLGDKFKFSDYQTDLQNIGYASTGNQLLYNGMTGEQIESQIFVGVNYYMRLKHMVKDKINYRAQGPMNFLTRQSVHGRANDGGLRLGEMERDAVITHGMSTFLKRSFMDRADAYKMAVCNKTGLISIYNPEKNLMMSPCADGPLKFQMDVNSEEFTIDTTTRFGRSFSVLDIPYSFKLFLQEIQVMGIQTRIITDKNIDNVLSLSGTDNIVKLTKDIDISEVLAKHKGAIHKYANAYRKERMGLIHKGEKKKTTPKKKIVAKADKEDANDAEEEEQHMAYDIGELEGGGEGVGEGEAEDVTYTIEGQPVAIPESTFTPQIIMPNISSEIPPPMLQPTPQPTPTSTPTTDALSVLQVPKEEEKKEDEADSTGASSGNTKAIVVDI